MTIHDHSLRALRRAWGSLPDPRLADLSGTFEASYVGAPLRTVAPRGLALVGLPRWFGKRFRPTDADAAHLTGVNLLRGADGTGLSETLPMTATVGPSLADGRPALLVTYPGDAPRPWRWVRDEFRPWDDDTLLGMTFVDVPGLRRAPGTPFVLTRRD
ncbi:hypothetical protein GEV29_02670 [Aeromicrobium sp. SMF47]|uniref:hypothetical protein n=1 Tax=Aeromicrobium TaxID=2040 RepID=UPI00129EFD15|nr:MULTISPECIES: hypothetical protein [Aeromicrobium]MRJ75429.1 hypothetical protein [Aeromicrobium yanjiei]MRK02514.1 hypothetical protein [Aeromicrobium sp. S22]